MQPTMQYKSFIWPHNPRTFESRLIKKTVALKHPDGEFTVQDLGGAGRIFEGAGEFYGPDAYRTFRALAAVFCQSGAGLLYHPSWQGCTAYFTALQLLQEPREDYISYAFTFQAAGMEDGEAVREALPETVTLGQDDTLAGVCARYGMKLQEVLAKNPQIANPAAVKTGSCVVLR